MGFLKDSAGSIAGGALSALGGLASTALSNSAASNLNLLNYKQAKEFAQNQIQWKVADAKKAGLHPLAALGMSPVMAPTATAIGDYSGLDRGLSDMGQNLSRSIDAYMTADQRRAEEDKAAALEEERLQMQRDEHKARMAESMANVALKQAEANRILNPLKDAQLRNYIKSRSVYSQPRIPARPRVNGKFNVKSIGGDRIMGVMIGPNGEKIYAPTDATAQRGQNMWGMLEAYGYASQAFKGIKDYATRYGRFIRRHANDSFQRALMW